MSTQACVVLAWILAETYMSMVAAHSNWRAAQLQHEHNLRGFIGCENGKLTIKNFDLGDTGSWVVFHLATEAENPCRKNQP